MLVGDQPVGRLERARAREPELSHVGEIEDADALAHRLVLRDLSGVLEGHQVAREGNDLRPEVAVLIVQRGLFRFGLSRRHGCSIDREAVGARQKLLRSCSSVCHALFVGAGVSNENRRMVSQGSEGE